MKKVCILLVVGFVQFAFANIVIREWSNYYELGTNYRVSADGYVIIMEGSNPDIPWKFEAFDGDTGEPADIRAILIQRTGDLGSVHLEVRGDPSQGHAHGAANVGTIDLVTDADADTYIDALEIRNDLGELGLIRATHLAGTCRIGNPENPETGHVLHPVVLDCATGTLQCNGLDDFSVGAELQMDASVEGDRVTSALRTCRVRAADATCDRQRGRTVRPAEMVGV